MTVRDFFAFKKEQSSTPEQKKELAQRKDSRKLFRMPLTNVEQGQSEDCVRKSMHSELKTPEGWLQLPNLSSKPSVGSHNG